MTSEIQTILSITDITVSGVLLLVLWQGLQRFDKLLDFLIEIAKHEADEQLEKRLSELFPPK